MSKILDSGIVYICSCFSDTTTHRLATHHKPPMIILQHLNPNQHQTFCHPKQPTNFCSQWFNRMDRNGQNCAVFRSKNRDTSSISCFFFCSSSFFFLIPSHGKKDCHGNPWEMPWAMPLYMGRFHSLTVKGPDLSAPFCLDARPSGKQTKSC